MSIVTHLEHYIHTCRLFLRFNSHDLSHSPWLKHKLIILLHKNSSDSSSSSSVCLRQRLIMTNDVWCPCPPTGVAEAWDAGKHLPAIRLRVNPRYHLLPVFSPSGEHWENLSFDVDKMQISNISANCSLFLRHFSDPDGRWDPPESRPVTVDSRRKFQMRIYGDGQQPRRSAINQIYAGLNADVRSSL